MTKKNLIACIVTTILVALGFLAYFSGLIGGHKTDTTYPSTEEVGRQYIGGLIEYEGHVYQYNSDLVNILFLGIDTSDSLNRFTEPAYAGQADAIYLLTLNRRTHEVKLLQINRNAMVDINIYDPMGQLMTTRNAQLCLQYAYGTGNTQSIWATKTAVSSMLMDIPINEYFVMNLEGINEINDAIGGVDVTMPSDYTWINAAFRAGEEVHIIGELAEPFVRYRDITVFNSIADRMERQVLYITAMLDSLSGMDGYSVYSMLEPLIGSSILTNIDSSGFSEMMEYNYQEYTVDLLPGEEVPTDRWEEFIIDSAALNNYVISNFYEIYE